MLKAISVLLCAALNAGAVAAAETPLFSSDEMLKAALSAPLEQAYAQKKLEKRLYLDGTWSYREGAETLRQPVKIRTRGNYRREVCSLPPLQLNFRKKELKGTLLEGQNKIKMVSPCKTGESYQQLVYLEHLVYELFALFSEHHFRTRLVEVGYTDSDQPQEHWSSKNFLIEDSDAMAARSGMKEVEIVSSRRDQMDLQQTALVEVFQYMIGNVDYSTLKGPADSDCCHNVKLIAPQGADTGYIPVPYDFDSAGIINAPYASVPAQVPVKSVTQRYFTGWCKEERRYREAIARLSEQREAAIALFAESALLDKKYSKRAVKYLEKFYDQVENERKVDRYIIGRCRGEVIQG